MVFSADKGLVASRASTAAGRASTTAGAAADSGEHAGGQTNFETNSNSNTTLVGSHADNN
jgi:hypothetical protein